MFSAFSLDVIQVASPCEANWNAMTGDAWVRHCDACRKQVYDLSEMTRQQAEALILAKEGKLCVKFFRRADGTILTADCPVGLWEAAHRKISYWLAAAAAGLMCLAALGAGIALSWGGRHMRAQQVLGGLQMSPPQVVPVDPLRCEMGDMEVPVPDEIPPPIDVPPIKKEIIIPW